MNDENPCYEKVNGMEGFQSQHGLRSEFEEFTTLRPSNNVDKTTSTEIDECLLYLESDDTMKEGLFLLYLMFMPLLYVMIFVLAKLVIQQNTEGQVFAFHEGNYPLTFVSLKNCLLAKGEKDRQDL